MDIYKFYRLEFSVRNLGIGLIAVFSVLVKGYIPSASLAGLSILHILLVQMHSFSMNHYFDWKVWDEDNYVAKLIEEGFSEKKVLFLTILPLILLSLTILLFPSKYIWLLVLYIILFFLYQAPGLRLKNHYLSSIILNALCLGWVLYAYPYLFLTGSLDLIFITFSVIFFFYMSFHEVIHQVAHLERDDIYSLPEASSIETTRIVAAAFLLIPIIFAIYTLFVDWSKYFFFTGTILFSTLRLYKLFTVDLKIGEFQNLRNRWDKLYSAHEAIYYVFFILLAYLF